MKKKAEIFGQVTLIHAASIADAKKLVVNDFKKYNLKLDVFEAEDTNLYFCSTKKRLRDESYFIYIVLDSDKFISEKNQNA